uniref:Reverse transcriptase domain-containing protein n=1 Tax=Megaselia scalaris TaxID=36166 RepID=T1GLV9_MEGSC
MNLELNVDNIGRNRFAGVNIKVLLYADSFQLMINLLGTYCENWRLTVNLMKSKVMVFRIGHGRYASNEKWRYKVELIEVVKEYVYLGFIISSNLSYENHIKRKELKPLWR